MDRIGRYKIVRELGRGAMGIVYHAIDPHIGRPVAIKTIQLSALRKPEEQERLRERLFREARSAGILSHPGIVTIYDVDQQDELAYIAMEYVDGPTLDHILSGEQPIEHDRMFSVLGQTAIALDYAHQKGIVHRDIKPANIMIANGGMAKITDFGIAKIAASDQFTMTGSIVGTPHYMSPEQVQGRAVEGHSDQFSLAVIAYEMLTGEKPYTGDHLTTVVYKIVTEDPPPPRHLNPSLSSGIEAALRKALAKKPEARYATCQQFSEALEKACGATAGWKTMRRGGSLNEPTLAVPARPRATLAPSRRPRTADATMAGRAVSRRSGFLTFLLAVLAAAGLLALLGWQALPWLAPERGSKPEAQAAQQTPAPAPAPVQAAEPAALQPEIASKVQAESQTKDRQEPESAGKSEAQLAAPPAEEKKPSPMPRDREPRAAGESAPDRPPAEMLQQVSIISSPADALATLDNRPETSCRTPCTIEAARGRHTLSVTRDGYQVERREVEVGTAPVEYPAIILRAQMGTLMVSSTPSGAAVFVDGRPTGQTTPAQLSLAPGFYQIGIEKGGRQAVQSVEIGDRLKQLRIVLDQ